MEKGVKSLYGIYFVTGNLPCLLLIASVPKILFWGFQWLKCPKVRVKRTVSILPAAPCVHCLLCYWGRVQRNREFRSWASSAHKYTDMHRSIWFQCPCPGSGKQHRACSLVSEHNNIFFLATMLFITAFCQITGLSGLEVFLWTLLQIQSPKEYFETYQS